MAKRGITDKIVFAHNPMPIVSDEQLLKLADLTDFRPATRDPFRIEWKAEGGLDSEWLTLGAGEFHPLREPEAKDFISSSDHRSLGMVVVPTNDPEDLRVLEASLDGLRAGHKFFLESGTKALVNLRKRMGCSKEELETDYRLEFWAMFYNQAKAKVIKEAMDALGKKIAAVRRAQSEPAPQPQQTAKRFEAPTGR